MSQFILYTDTDQIRSTFGLEEEEVSDDLLSFRGLEKELKLDLIDWLPTHATLYAAGKSISATDTQKSITDALNLYCTYFCCSISAESLPMLAAQAITDGKNGMDRFSTIDWKALSKYMSGRMAYYKSLILRLNASTSTTTTYSPFTKVGLTTDPVTTPET